MQYPYFLFGGESQKITKEKNKQKDFNFSANYLVIN